MAYRPLKNPVSPETLHEDSDAYGAHDDGLRAGDRIGRFQVLEWIGEGGSASVYRIQHRQLESDYALKVLHGISSQTAIDRLIQEGKLQSNLQHPHIVRVHDVLEVRGAPALVMDYVDGHSLAYELEAKELGPEQVEKVFRQIVDAVDAAHKAGIVHRDLKPANVIVTGDENELIAHVTDFGIARADGLEISERTRTGALIGTLEYMSPEQIRGDETILAF